MKHTKKLLALLLVLALGAGLAVPALAAGDAMPVITKQPQSVTVEAIDDGIGFGLTGPMNLSVEATIPNSGEVGYQWYYQGENGDNFRKCESGEEASYTTTAEECLGGSNWGRTTYYHYYCVVYNRAEGEDGPNSVQSNVATVTWKLPWWKVSIWTISFFIPLGFFTFGVTWLVAISMILLDYVMSWIYRGK